MANYSLLSKNGLADRSWTGSEGCGAFSGAYHAVRFLPPLHMLSKIQRLKMYSLSGTKGIVEPLRGVWTLQARPVRSRMRSGRNRFWTGVLITTFHRYDDAS